MSTQYIYYYTVPLLWLSYLHDISVLSVVVLLQGDEDHFHRSTKESLDMEDLLKLLANQNDSDYKNKTIVSTYKKRPLLFIPEWSLFKHTSSKY